MVPVGNRQLPEPVFTKLQGTTWAVFKIIDQYISALLA